MVLVGIVAWIVTGFSGVPLIIHWPNTLGVSVLLAALTIAAWNLVVGSRKLRSLSLLLLTLIAALVIDITAIGPWTRFGSFLWSAEQLSQWRHDVAVLSWLYAQCTSFVLLGIALARTACSATVSRAVRLAAAVALVIAAVAIAIPLGTLYWRMSATPPKPPAQLEAAENVYPRIIEIGAPMEMASPKQAQAIYQQLLPLLDRTGYVPLDFSDPYAERRLVSIQQARSIARAMDVQGDALDVQGQHEAAVEYSASILKLAHMQSRGGLAIDTLVGHAIETVGRYRLVQHRADYSSETKLRILNMLLDFDSARESIDVLLERDIAFTSRSDRWIFAMEYQFPYELFGLSTEPNLGIVRGTRDALKRQQTGCRLLYMDLAVRLFREANGRLPQKLDELVPQYLPKAPIDPHSGKPFVYRASGGKVILYGVGSDGIDNGGTPRPPNQHHNSPGIDWDLASWN